MDVRRHSNVTRRIPRKEQLAPRICCQGTPIHDMPITACFSKPRGPVTFPPDVENRAARTVSIVLCPLEQVYLGLHLLVQGVSWTPFQVSAVHCPVSHPPLYDMATCPPPVNLNETWGVVLMSCFGTMALWGINSMQWWARRLLLSVHVLTSRAQLYLL